MTFLADGMTLARGETLADALPVWRRFAAQKPALLLLSNDPALLPAPEPLRGAIAETLRTAPDAAVRAAGDPLRPAPLFLPGMSVDLALRQGWLRELVWVFPQSDGGQELKLEVLREQLTGNRLADSAEAATLQLTGKTVGGRLRGVPFRAAPLAHLPQPDGPVIVHIDLSYVHKSHKNEIATPVIPLVGGILQQLKAKHLPVLAVTFSYNHGDGSIPLGVRFLGDFVAALVEKPERLDQPLPRRWQAQKDMLYLENFFQKDDIRKLVEEQTKDSPDAAWVQFNRYHVAALFKEGDQALAHLASAVALDRMYAVEYLTLAERAGAAGRPAQELRMMELAGAAFPENVLIKLRIAELRAAAGDNSAARTLAAELLQLPWSATYYPDMREYLHDFLAKLEK
ncbi:MAG: hypothetical protein FDZ69_09280 [Deltaproteobacteria bacterium]|nr:MAG: hypothetical protein FDZ69_09280 [Deltaproteobacteria bacterium]